MSLVENQIAALREIEQVWPGASEGERGARDARAQAWARVTTGDAMCATPLLILRLYLCMASQVVSLLDLLQETLKSMAFSSHAVSHGAVHIGGLALTILLCASGACGCAGADKADFEPEMELATHRSALTTLPVVGKQAADKAGDKVDTLPSCYAFMYCVIECTSHAPNVDISPFLKSLQEICVRDCERAYFPCDPTPD